MFTVSAITIITDAVLDIIELSLTMFANNIVAVAIITPVNQISTGYNFNSCPVLSALANLLNSCAYAFPSCVQLTDY